MCCEFRNGVLWCILISAFLGGVSLADSVSVETAQKAALQQINKVMSSKSQALAKSEDGSADKGFRVFELLTADNVGEIICERENGQAVYYVITLKPEGWVIVSADDVAHPIIAYSDTGFYSALPEDQPPAFKAWMANVKADIHNAITKKLEPLPEAEAAWEQIEGGGKVAVSIDNQKGLAASVAPLIRTKWGQGFPVYVWPVVNTGDYNYYCPYEIWVNVITYAQAGCGATAMAQIMKYYEWPVVGQGSHSYTTPYQCAWGNWGCTYGKQSANFGATYYNWADMPLTGSTKSVALLMYHCGVATDMNYGFFGSGTELVDLINPYDYNRKNVRNAMLNYFRYHTVWYLKDSTTIGAPPKAWDILLKENLDAGKPVIYAGEKSRNVGGHAFICDGYDDTGKFHFNWGWTGSYDAYYHLDDLTPSSGDYNYRQQALFDIYPKYNSAVWVDDDYAGLPSGATTPDGHTYGTDAFSSVQEGINRVEEGGTVIIHDGRYYENIDVDKSITLQGFATYPGADRPTIYGRPGPKPVIKVTAPAASIVLEGLILRDGVGFYFDGSRKGGGLCIVDANDVVIDDCAFGNEVPDAGDGGGIYAQNTVLHVRNSDFWGNSVTGAGGGIYALNTVLCVRDSRFTLNSATYGGGMCLINTTGNVTNCTFESNNAAEHGGGIFLRRSVTPLVSDCVFKNNNANFGGGIFNDQSTPADIRNCLFQNNSAYHRGGGMYNWTASVVAVTNCTFYGNEVTYDPPKEGGGIANSGCAPVITNCILWNNTPNQMHSTEGDPVVTYCDIGQAGFGAPDGSADANGNINKDPMFANAAGDDFHLLDGSLAIDAGSNEAVPVGMETDMDGNRRIRHGDCDGTADVDMGIYEFIHNVPGDCTGDCDINMLDFARLSARWHTAECGWCDGVDMTGDGRIDMADLAVISNHWLQTH